jgi:hypothetical protein
MNATSLGIAMRRLAAIAFVVVLTPMARSPYANPALVVDQSTGKFADAAAIVLAQGRCFNGKCF